MYRGYQADQHIFQNFPDDVKWFEATITKDELDKVMYINWEYWLEISDGNRSPKYVAQKISSGKLPDDKEIRRFKTIAQEIKLGIKLPRLILIAENVSAQLVVLEGHARITALMLILESLPKNIEVIVGFSKKMMNYGLYNAEAWQD